MIVVRITGGLGNQMFQVAFARTLQARGKNVVIHWHGHRTKSRHNGWELDRVFDTPLSNKIKVANQSLLLSGIAWAMRKTVRTREPKNVGYSPQSLDASRGYLDGYWQTEKYFTSIEETIREDFQFNPLEGEPNLELAARIASEPCVSVHVRRGDYVDHSSLGGVCGPEYYNASFARLDETHPDCTPIIFSDDIAYCRNLFSGRKAVFVDWNQRESSWMDMALMSQCRHHIIANSSFSWWGSWLGTTDGMVICPKKWFSTANEGRNGDICPTRWAHLNGEGAG